MTVERVATDAGSMLALDRLGPDGAPVVVLMHGGGQDPAQLGGSGRDARCRRIPRAEL